MRGGTDAVGDFLSCEAYEKICAGQAGENAAFPIRREKLRAQVALWDRAGDEPLELSLSFDDGASGRRARRGKYRDF